MGKSRTLVYQLGRRYKMTNIGKFSDYGWQVVKTNDYKKKNGLIGQRVHFLNLINNKTLEREQQYR